MIKINFGLKFILVVQVFLAMVVFLVGGAEDEGVCFIVTINI